MSPDIIRTIQFSKEKLDGINKLIPIKLFTLRLEELDNLISQPELWEDPRRASALSKERERLNNIVTKIKYFEEQISFYQECISSFPEELISLFPQIQKLYDQLSDFEFQQMMNDPADDSPAIITINAGAGGLEAANWVTMMLRMYSRWAESNNFKIEILDEKPCEEHSAICTDSVSIRIEGSFAFGFLKGESGVHRLIRNSPFNADNLRQTSFAAVAVSPDIEDTIEIKIEEKDLEITAQRAGGPGGQHQNKTSSAIRLRHLPTGINILVRAERDQHANRKIAMKMLKSKLYELEKKKQMSEEEKRLDSLKNISFGHQLRTYTLTPYSLIKDHRTEYEDRNSNSVLDGNLTEFMKAFLRFNKNENI